VWFFKLKIVSHAYIGVLSVMFVLFFKFSKCVRVSKKSKTLLVNISLVFCQGHLLESSLYYFDFLF
jgi:hypothetical protein